MSFKRYPNWNAVDGNLQIYNTVSFDNCSTIDIESELRNQTRYLSRDPAKKWRIRLANSENVANPVSIRHANPSLIRLANPSSVQPCLECATNGSNYYVVRSSETVPVRNDPRMFGSGINLNYPVCSNNSSSLCFH